MTNHLHIPSNETLSTGTILYLHQNGKTLGSRILGCYTEDINALVANSDTMLFVVLARMMAELSPKAYDRINVYENLHIRIESISSGSCVYDSADLQIPNYNRTLSLGTGEKSFTSFTLTHSALWNKFHHELPYRPDYMYRRYLHMGTKPTAFAHYIDHEGSLLWHALYSDTLPRTINTDAYYQEITEDTIPF